MYEGDSFLRPDAAIGATIRRLSKTPEVTPDFVRSNTQVEAANLTEVDIHAIEQAAHELRRTEMARLLRNAATSMASGLKAVHTAVVDWLERIEYQERDSFFAGSANLADLEQRQRHWERSGHAHY
jgi:hypothetical protein